MTYQHSTAQAPLRGVPDTSTWLAKNNRQRTPGEQPMRRLSLIERVFRRG